MWWNEDWNRKGTSFAVGALETYYYYLVTHSLFRQLNGCDSKANSKLEAKAFRSLQTYTHRSDHVNIIYIHICMYVTACDTHRRGPASFLKRNVGISH